LKSSDKKRAGEEIDLTNFVEQIDVRKGLFDPAGEWEISLVPFQNKKGLSWYYTVSPMDYIEISFSRISTEPLEVVMRGFVDSVNLKTSVDSEGRPSRSYVITGRDFGKMMDITRIYWLKEISPDLPLLALPGWQRLKERYGWQMNGKPVELIEDLLGIVQSQIDLLKNNCKGIPQIKFLGSDGILGDINQFSMTQEDGSIWEFMQYLNNSPWNELYIMDYDDAPYLVFRKTPWKNTRNQLIQGDDSTYKQTMAKTLSLEKSDLLSVDISRSDAEVKNYFFTFPVAYLATGQTAFKTAVLDGVDSELELRTNPYFIHKWDRDAGLYRFGFRRFENSSEYLDLNDIGTSKALCRTLNENMVEAFRYNSAYESGTMKLKGNHKIKPGIYVSLKNQAGLVAEYYVNEVNHSLSFTEGSESFFTTLNVTRGTGYLLTRDIDAYTVEKMPYERN